MFSRYSHRVLPLLALVVLGACGGQRQVRPGEDVETTPVVVRNQSWSEVRVYAVSTAGQRTRLGNVAGTATVTLQIPAAVVGIGNELRFEVLPVGSRAPASSFSMYVRPGETVTLTIPPQVR
jgi:hypothetical protein